MTLPTLSLAEFAADEWRSQAACFGLSAEEIDRVFFPHRGQSTEPAKRICRTCAVAGECLEYALTHFLKDGVWGGQSERQRRRTRRERHYAKLGVEPPIRLPKKRCFTHDRLCRRCQREELPEASRPLEEILADIVQLSRAA